VLFIEKIGFDPDADTAGDESRERVASLELLLTIASDIAWSDESSGATQLAAELDRRDAAEAAAQGIGINLLTYHRAKGLEWDAVFLPAVEEGLLPIRQAKTPEQIAEERRLLYVGITRARTHLAISWSRKPSRFIDDIRPRSMRTIPSAAGPGQKSVTKTPLLEALQMWRRERAQLDAVPAYVVAHDAMLAAIAEDRPNSIAQLRRIKGMGPVKLDQYGPEILEIVARK
jgi:DNA helicase-2/ATP-dependent DNA helicase PcrA